MITVLGFATPTIGRSALCAALLAVLFSLSGCTAKKAISTSKENVKDQKVDGKPEKPQLIESASTGRGKGERFDPTKGSVLWNVRWERANLSFGQKGAFFGQMATVSGEVFQNGKKIGTYKAETGIADEKSNKLTLKGKVQFHSIAYKSDLFAEEVQYRPDQEVLEAKGNVTVEGTRGYLGPLDALISTSDLRVLGTPDSMERFLANGAKSKREGTAKRPTVQTDKQSHP